MTSGKKVAELVSFLFAARCFWFANLRMLFGDDHERREVFILFLLLIADKFRGFSTWFRCCETIRNENLCSSWLSRLSSNIFTTPAPSELWDNARWKKKSGKKERKQRARKKKRKNEQVESESSQIFNEIDLHFRIINAMNALNFYFTHSRSREKLLEQVEKIYKLCAISMAMAGEKKWQNSFSAWFRQRDKLQETPTLCTIFVHEQLFFLFFLR